MENTTLIRALAGRLIVSCQAPEGNPFRDSISMARFARSAAIGGAAAIRANGADDIRAIRKAVSLPIIGIQKRLQTDGRVLITPSFEDARELVSAGADIIAVECTLRGQQSGALESIRRIRSDLGVPVMADIALAEDAVAAENAGADLVASTMRGYTDETRSIQRFDPEFIRALKQCLRVPVIAEGRIRTPIEAAEAMRAGAYAVIIGGAITRPEGIAAAFAEAIERTDIRQLRFKHIIGVDLGASKTKAAIVEHTGRLHSEFTIPTPGRDGRDALLDHLKRVTHQLIEASRRAQIEPAAIGIATAGWVDPHTGQVVYATPNLPDWSGARIGDAVHSATGLPVIVENDGNATAMAERRFGCGRNVDDFVCITLGTGVGGGSYIGGRLVRGAHYGASALGHIPIQLDGLLCNCGQNGCLEAYTSASALLEYAGPPFRFPQEVIQAATAGNITACGALKKYSRYLAAGIRCLVRLSDPKLLIFSGGIAQDNPLLIEYLNEQLSCDLQGGPAREVQVQISQLGYYAGVLGAGAALIESELFI